MKVDSVGTHPSGGPVGRNQPGGDPDSGIHLVGGHSGGSHLGSHLCGCHFGGGWWWYSSCWG